MALFRTPLIDKNQPVVLLDGPNAGCVTPYFQRTLLDITKGADLGQQAGTDFGPLIATKVDMHTSAGWTAATGTGSKAGFATYTAPVISNPPTQAEVQAVANAVQVHAQHLKALLDALISAGVLN